MLERPKDKALASRLRKMITNVDLLNSVSDAISKPRQIRLRAASLAAPATLWSLQSNLQTTLLYRRHTLVRWHKTEQWSLIRTPAFSTYYGATTTLSEPRPGEWMSQTASTIASTRVRQAPIAVLEIAQALLIPVQRMVLVLALAICKDTGVCCQIVRILLTQGQESDQSAILHRKCSKYSLCCGCSPLGCLR